MKYNRTIEQSNIVSCLDENIVVNAFAGTGKTSTLIDYTKTNNEETYLYLAFNKSVQENASKKFNSHVRCSTSHSLAYRDIGFKFKDKLGQTKAATISKIFKCNFATASVALNSLNNFLYSADYYLDIEKHLDKNHSTGMNVNLAFSITEKIWKSMQDTSNPYIRMSHDGYLKLYHLSNPKILMDVILIDEAQDSNMVLLDIVNKQKARKIYIGDTNQNIYGFRKSIDALSLNTDATKFNLTGSFRFGDGIAKLATLLLQEWKGEKNTIKGLGDTKTKFSVNKNNPHAILARTNSGLFDAAIEALLSNKPFGYVGGPEGYRLDMILDAWHLKQGKNHLITDPTILLFSSFNELVDYAESIDDKECKMLIRVI
jgi:F-box protein 18 (helicase)